MANDQERGVPTLAQEARRRKSLDRVHSGLISVPPAEERSHRRLPRDFFSAKSANAVPQAIRRWRMTLLASARRKERIGEAKREYHMT